MEREKKILKLLEKEYGYVGSFLTSQNPWQLLIATILSAQSTDKQVNKVTPALFKKYRTPKALAEANLDEVKKMVRSTGYYNQKAKRIIGASKAIIDDYGGKVPDEMEELVKIPGVGRKTANIVLSYGMGKTQGVAVDTHVKRVSFRLGLTKSKNPAVIEQDLMRIYERRDWDKINTMIVDHGRAVCNARKPHCSKCLLASLCPRKEVVFSD